MNPERPLCRFSWPTLLTSVAAGGVPAATPLSLPSRVLAHTQTADPLRRQFFRRLRPQLSRLPVHEHPLHSLRGHLRPTEVEGGVAEGGVGGVVGAAAAAGRGEG